MKTLDLKAIDPAELAPIPDVPESYGPRNEEEKAILSRIEAALAGEFAPLDRNMFRRPRNAPKSHS